MLPGTATNNQNFQRLLPPNVLTRITDVPAFDGKHYATNGTNQQAYWTDNGAEDEEDRLFKVC